MTSWAESVRRGSREGPVWTTPGELPDPGDILAWTGPMIYEERFPLSASSASDFDGNPGVLHPRRPYHPILESDRSVPPDSSIELLRPLREGEESASQVWLCKVNEHELVLKLYYGAYEAWDRWSAILTDETPDAERDAEGQLPPPDYHSIPEAEADHVLSKAQGSLVPYCYGFYKFRLPNNDLCNGTLLEYIDGKKLYDEIKSYLRPKEIPFSVAADKTIEIVISLFEAVMELHKLGIVHRDLANRNISLLPPLAGSSAYPPYPIVLFDFGRSAPVSIIYRSTSDYITVDSSGMYDFLEDLGFHWILDEWHDGDGPGKKWRTYCQVHPETLPEEERAIKYYHA